MLAPTSTGDRSILRQRRALSTANPAARRRELASRLRQLRVERGLTVEEVANQLLCSPPKISRVETGARPANMRDIRDLASVYHLSNDEMQFLMSLAREARQPGWWEQYYDPTLSQYVGLEQEATSIISFSRYSVPALLQTREYARAILENSARRYDRDKIDGQAGVLIRRQELLKQPSLRYTAFLDEAVLHRQVGGAERMYAQLEKLSNILTNSGLAVHILPFTAGIYSVVESNFQFLEFDDIAQQPPLLFIEGAFGNGTLNRPNEIEVLRRESENLRQIALSTRQSADLITSIMSTYGRWRP